MQEKPFDLRGPAGRLEARVSHPESEPAFAAVVAHPHPLYGGNMSNAVVQWASEELAGLGAATLRFNFRGVGESEGTHDNGKGEALDLAAAEDALAREIPGRPLWLVGYSFGAVMVFRRLDGDARPTAAVLLAPPVPHYDFSSLSSCPTPLGLIVGQQDDIAPASQVQAEATKWPSVTHLQTLDPAGHDLGTMSDDPRLRQALQETISALMRISPAEP